MTALDQAFIKAYSQQGDAETSTRRAIESVLAMAEATAPPPADEPFRALLQVDDFVWPSICRRLEEQAAVELDRVADALVDLADAGARVLTIAGCRRGDGATTLLLCVARRLAARGRKVAVADAEWSGPQLARRLGVEPEYGWEDVTAGRVPLEEVVIESAAGGQALLPVGDVGASSDATQHESSRIAGSLDTLAAHYDLVLIDLGPLDGEEPFSVFPRQVIAERLDAAVLVENERTASGDKVLEMRSRLSQAGIRVAGTIRNFVRA